MSSQHRRHVWRILLFQLPLAWLSSTRPFPDRLRARWKRGRPLALGPVARSGSLRSVGHHAQATRGHDQADCVSPHWHAKQVRFPARHGSLAYDLVYPGYNVLVAHGQSPDWSPGLGLVDKHRYMVQRIAFGWRPPVPIQPDLPHVQTIWITAHERSAKEFQNMTPESAKKAVDEICILVYVSRLSSSAGHRTNG